MRVVSDALILRIRRGVARRRITAAARELAISGALYALVRRDELGRAVSAALVDPELVRPSRRLRRARRVRVPRLSVRDSLALYVIVLLALAAVALAFAWTISS